MAFPTFKAAGTFTAGTGAITPPYPADPNAPVANDIAILVCESENQAISLSTAQGFVELGAQANKAAGSAAVNPASRLAIFWKRCVGGDTAPTVADSGNHTTGRIYLFSGVKTTGDPWNVYAEGNDGGANDTSGVIPGATTTVDECLIFLICTSSYNGTSTAQFSAWANGALANILERGDNTNTAGLGGGHGSATGEKATAGAYGNTTVTLAQTSYKGAMSIALEPPAGQTVQLAGTSNGGSTAIGLLSRRRPMVGGSAGLSTAIGLLSRWRPLVGASEGTSSAVGILTIIEGETKVYLAGLSQGIASAIGTMLAKRGLVGQSAGVGSATGELLRRRGLAGWSDGISAAIALLSRRRGLGGLSQGISSANGILTAKRGLMGLSSGNSMAVASLSRKRTLIGASQGTSTATGKLSIEGEEEVKTSHLATLKAG